MRAPIVTAPVTVLAGVLAILAVTTSIRSEDVAARAMKRSPAEVAVWAGSNAQARLVGTGVRLVTGTRPSCDATTRGLLFYVAGGAGVADTIEVCGKAAADTYSWVAMATF